MSEFGKYIGLEFENRGRGPKFDCLGLVLHIFKEEKNIILPDYLNIEYDCEWPFSGSTQLITDNTNNKKWIIEIDNINNIMPYDCLTFFRKENSIIVNHIGLYIGNYKFIHILSHQTSEISRLESYKNRLHKILRYKAVK